MEPPSFPPSGLHTVRAAPGSPANLVLPLPAGSPPFVYTWSRAGASLDERFTTSHDATGVRLTVSAARTGDTDVYTLQASNAAGTDTSRVRLEVSSDETPTGEDPPTFLRRLQDLTVKVGTRTRFLVEIVSSTECKVTWFRNERRLLEAERVSLARDGNFWCADVAAVSVDDAGRWTCTAENVGGRASCSAHLNVLVPKAYKRPEFVEELRALLTEQGTVSLECKVVGVPTPVLRWFKDSREIKAGDVFALTANAEDPTSLGTYTCEAVNCMGRAYSSSKVHVIGRGSREGSSRPSSSLAPEPPPIFTKELEDQFIKITAPLTLSCHIVVPPWPRSVVWYNKEGKVEPSDRYHVLEDGAGGYLLEIGSAEWPDEGEWKCVACSSGGRVGISTCYVTMDVPKNYRKPRFMENLQAVLTEEGLVSFECKVVGFPTPVLSWFKDGQELKPGDVYQLTGTNSLGSYCCIARNCMGQASSSAELTVEDIQNQLNEEEKHQLFQAKNQAPKFIQGLKSVEAKIDEPFRFTVKVAIPPEPSVLWYRDDQPVDECSRCHHGKEDRGVFYLDIQNLEFLDQAEWKCVAMNDFGHSVTSCFLKLIIPRHYKKPRFLENLQAILSDEGAVNLECKVIGVPQPVLKWYKDGEELKPGDIHRIISGQDGTCCLGTYTCEAQNCMGIAASSASLLGFDDSMKAKKKKAEEQALQRNLSLSTIHEERTSQMYDTPVGDITLNDDKGEISFSFDGKEVSVSLYETPDLTEEEALQIVEMYADQLSENITEHNVVELPPLRFVKETSTSGNLLMEAVIIDVSPDYFQSPDEDLRTEADVEDISIADENAASLLSLEKDDIGREDYLEKTMPMLTDEKSDFPPKSSRKKSDSQRSVDDFFSLSRDQSLSEEKRDDDTQPISESDIPSFASAHSSSKPKSKSSKPSGEDGQEFSEPTKTILFKEDAEKHLLELEKSPAVRPNGERGISCTSRRSSSGSEKSVSKPKEEALRKHDSLEIETLKKPHMSESEFKEKVRNVSNTLAKMINDIQIIERDIILKSELMSSAATASRSLEIISSLISPLSEIHSVADAAKEAVSELREVSSSLFNNLPKPLKALQQSLTIIEKCIDMESDGRTLVKKTCVAFIETCGSDMQQLLSEINEVTSKDYLNTEDAVLTEIESINNEIHNVIKFSSDTIKARSLISEASDIKSDESSQDVKHLRNTQKAVFELRNPLNSLISIAESVDVDKVTNSELLLNDMSEAIQDLQTALEEIETLSIKEATSLLNKYSTEIIKTVMDPVIKLRTSFEQLATKTKSDDKIVLNQAVTSIKENLNKISSQIDVIESNVGEFDILASDNKLNALQKMAQILIALENNLSRLDTLPVVKNHMTAFHKDLTKILENVIESNDSKKYFSLLEICGGVHRLNAAIKNLDEDQLMYLTSLNNTLNIIKGQFINTVFDSELNCSILTNIKDTLLGIQEAINNAEEISIQINSEHVQDITTPTYQETNAGLLIEHFEHTIAAIENVKVLESINLLKINIAPTLHKICPTLVELKESVAAFKANLHEEQHISEMSETSSIINGLATPICELNQNLMVLSQQIIENIESMKECSEIITTLAEPLHELHTTLEILQQDVISQYSDFATPQNLDVNMANAVHSLQSCIVMIHEQAAVEGADDMSTLEDVSGIKTTADTLPPDHLVLPTAEETVIEQSLLLFDQELPTSATGQVLQTLNEHITTLQSPDVIEALDTLSEVSDFTSLKSFIVNLDELHIGIEEVFHPIPMEGSHEIVNLINPSKLMAIAEPMQELQQYLSVLDISNIPIYENLLEMPAEKIHSLIQKITDFKDNLDICMLAVFPALQSTDKTVEMANKIGILREVCENLKTGIDTSKNATTIKMSKEMKALENTVDKLLEATDISKGIKIDQVRTITEDLYEKVIAVQEEIIQFTPRSSAQLAHEAKLIETIDEVQSNIAVLEQYDFVDLSRASDMSCTSLQVAIELKSDSLAHISDLVDNAVNVVQDAAQDTPLTDLIILEDFFRTCKNDFTVLRYLISKQPTRKKIIRLLQEFKSLQSTIAQFKINRSQLNLSDNVNTCLTTFLSHADDCLQNIQNSLVKIVDSLVELLINEPLEKLNSSEILLTEVTTAKYGNIMQEVVMKLTKILEISKPIFTNVHKDVIEDLKNPITHTNECKEIIEKIEVFTTFINELKSQSGDGETKNILEKLLTCIDNHQDYNDASGTGRSLILIKCLSDCVSILQKEILKVETVDHKVEDRALNVVLTEMLQPLKALQSQLKSVQEQVSYGIDEDTVSVDITTTESLVQTMAEKHKEIIDKIELEPDVANEDIALIMELDKEIHLIQDSLKTLDDVQTVQIVRDITKPVGEIEKSLHSIMSTEKIRDRTLSTDNVEQIIEHIDQYIELIEIVEEISAIIRIEDIKETMDIAKELRESFATSDIITKGEVSEDKWFVIRQEQASLAHKLQTALSSLQVQVLERTQELAPEISAEVLQRIAKVTSQLQTDLVVVTSMHITLQAPAELIEKVEVTEKPDIVIRTTEETVIAADTEEPTLKQQDINKHPIFGEQLFATTEMLEKMIEQPTGIASKSEKVYQESTEPVMEIEKELFDDASIVSSAIIPVEPQMLVEDSGEMSTAEVTDNVVIEKNVMNATDSISPQDKELEQIIPTISSTDIGFKVVAVLEEEPLVKSDLVIEYIDQYISAEVTDVISKLSNCLKSTDLMHSINAAQELRESIRVSKDGLEDETSIFFEDKVNIQKAQLLNQHLHTALTVLKDVPLDTLSELSTVDRNTVLKVLQITSNLLVALTPVRADQNVVDKTKKLDGTQLSTDFSEIKTLEIVALKDNSSELMEPTKPVVAEIKENIPEEMHKIDEDIKDHIETTVSETTQLSVETENIKSQKKTVDNNTLLERTELTIPEIQLSTAEALSKTAEETLLQNLNDFLSHDTLQTLEQISKTLKVDELYQTVAAAQDLLDTIISNNLSLTESGKDELVKNQSLLGYKLQNSLSTIQVLLAENVEELFPVVSEGTLQQVNILVTSLSTQLVPIISQVQHKLQGNTMEKPNLALEENTNQIHKNSKSLQQDIISVKEPFTDQKTDLQTLTIVDDEDIAQNILNKDVEELILIERPSIITAECKKANETLLNASNNKKIKTAVKSEILGTEWPDTSIKPELVIGSEITEITKEELERLTLIEIVTQDTTKILIDEDSANSYLVTTTSTPTILNNISKDETPCAEYISSGFNESSNISKQSVDVLQCTHLRSESQPVENLTANILDLNVTDNSIATIEPETTVRSVDIKESVKSNDDNYVQVMTEETVLLADLDGETINISEATEVTVTESDTGRALSDIVSAEPNTLNFSVKTTLHYTQEESIKTPIVTEQINVLIQHGVEDNFVNNICDDFSAIETLQDETNEIKNMKNIALYEEPDNVLVDLNILKESELMKNIETSTTGSLEEITSPKTVQFIKDNIETTPTISDVDKQSTEQILAADSILTNITVESTSPIALEKVIDCQQDATEKDSQLTDLVKESVPILMEKKEVNHDPLKQDVSRDIQIDAQVSEPEQTLILQDLSLCQQEDLITEEPNNKKSKAEAIISVGDPIQAIEISEILPKEPSTELSSPKTIIEHAGLIIHLDEFASGEVSELVNEILILTHSEDLKGTTELAQVLKENLAETGLLEEVTLQRIEIAQKLQEALSALHATALDSVEEITSTIKPDALVRVSEVITYLQNDLATAILSDLPQIHESTEIHEMHIVEENSLEHLTELLQEASEKINVTTQDADDIETLKNVLDEVQTVIMKLKRDYDGISNDTLNETLEDLECSVRSVQLQIDEASPPELLKEACDTLQLLVNNMTETKQVCVTEIEATEASSKDILKKCSAETEDTIKLLEKASLIEIKHDDDLHKLVASLNVLKDTIKTLKVSFTSNADVLIEKGVDIMQSLNILEDKVFSLEKDLSRANIKEDVRDNILTAIHSVFGNISNMRGTIATIQKRYMFENYGRPSEILLKSIKNIVAICEIDAKDKSNWKTFSKTLRKVLNHFEDIKFYINLDKTARLPSDAAFTKIILKELESNITDILLPQILVLGSDVINKVNEVVESIQKNMASIESSETLEVKEKIPIFKETSALLFNVTEFIKAEMYKVQEQKILNSEDIVEHKNEMATANNAQEEILKDETASNLAQNLMENIKDDESHHQKNLAQSITAIEQKPVVETAEVCKQISFEETDISKKMGKELRIQETSIESEVFQIASDLISEITSDAINQLQSSVGTEILEQQIKPESELLADDHLSVKATAEENSAVDISSVKEEHASKSEVLNLSEETIIPGTHLPSTETSEKDENVFSKNETENQTKENIVTDNGQNKNIQEDLSESLETAKVETDESKNIQNNQKEVAADETNQEDTSKQDLTKDSDSKEESNILTEHELQLQQEQTELESKGKEKADEVSLKEIESKQKSATSKPEHDKEADETVVLEDKKLQEKPQYLKNLEKEQIVQAGTLSSIEVVTEKSYPVVDQGTETIATQEITEKEDSVVKEGENVKEEQITTIYGEVNKTDKSREDSPLVESTENQEKCKYVTESNKESIREKDGEKIKDTSKKLEVPDEIKKIEDEMIDIKTKEFINKDKQEIKAQREKNNLGDNETKGSEAIVKIDHKEQIPEDESVKRKDIVLVQKETEEQAIVATIIDNEVKEIDIGEKAEGKNQIAIKEKSENNALPQKGTEGVETEATKDKTEQLNENEISEDNALVQKEIDNMEAKKSEEKAIVVDNEIKETEVQSKIEKEEQVTKNKDNFIVQKAIEDTEAKEAKEKEIEMTSADSEIKQIGALCKTEKKGTVVESKHEKRKDNIVVPKGIEDTEAKEAEEKAVETTIDDNEIRVIEALSKTASKETVDDNVDEKGEDYILDKKETIDTEAKESEEKAVEVTVSDNEFKKNKVLSQTEGKETVEENSDDRRKANVLDQRKTTDTEVEENKVKAATLTDKEALKARRKTEEKEADEKRKDSILVSKGTKDTDAKEAEGKAIDSTLADNRIKEIEALSKTKKKEPKAENEDAKRKDTVLTQKETEITEAHKPKDKTIEATLIDEERNESENDDVKRKGSVLMQQETECKEPDETEEKIIEAIKGKVVEKGKVNAEDNTKVEKQLVDVTTKQIRDKEASEEKRELKEETDIEKINEDSKDTMVKVDNESKETITTMKKEKQEIKSHKEAEQDEAGVQLEGQIEDATTKGYQDFKTLIDKQEAKVETKDEKAEVIKDTGEIIRKEKEPIDLDNYSRVQRKVEEEEVNIKEQTAEKIANRDDKYTDTSVMKEKPSAEDKTEEEQKKIKVKPKNETALKEDKIGEEQKENMEAEKGATYKKREKERDHAEANIQKVEEGTQAEIKHEEVGAQIGKEESKKETEDVQGKIEEEEGKPEDKTIKEIEVIGDEPKVECKDAKKEMIDSKFKVKKKKKTAEGNMQKKRVEIQTGQQKALSAKEDTKEAQKEVEEMDKDRTIDMEAETIKGKGETKVKTEVGQEKVEVKVNKETEDDTIKAKQNEEAEAKDQKEEYKEDIQIKKEKELKVIAKDVADNAKTQAEQEIKDDEKEAETTHKGLSTVLPEPVAISETEEEKDKLKEKIKEIDANDKKEHEDKKAETKVEVNTEKKEFEKDDKVATKIKEIEVMAIEEVDDTKSKATIESNYDKTTIQQEKTDIDTQVSKETLKEESRIEKEDETEKDKDVKKDMIEAGIKVKREKAVTKTKKIIKDKETKPIKVKEETEAKAEEEAEQLEVQNKKEKDDANIQKGKLEPETESHKKMEEETSSLKESEGAEKRVKIEKEVTGDKAKKESEVTLLKETEERPGREKYEGNASGKQIKEAKIEETDSKHEEDAEASKKNEKEKTQTIAQSEIQHITVKKEKVEEGKVKDQMMEDAKTEKENIIIEKESVETDIKKEKDEMETKTKRSTEEQVAKDKQEKEQLETKIKIETPYIDTKFEKDQTEMETSEQREQAETRSETEKKHKIGKKDEMDVEIKSTKETKESITKAKREMEDEKDRINKDKNDAKKKNKKEEKGQEVKGKKEKEKTGVRPKEEQGGVGVQDTKGMEQEETGVIKKEEEVKAKAKIHQQDKEDNSKKEKEETEAKAKEEQTKVDILAKKSTEDEEAKVTKKKGESKAKVKKQKQDEEAQAKKDQEQAEAKANEEGERVDIQTKKIMEEEEVRIIMKKKESETTIEKEQRLETHFKKENDKVEEKETKATEREEVNSIKEKKEVEPTKKTNILKVEADSDSINKDTEPKSKKGKKEEDARVKKDKDVTKVKQARQGKDVITSTIYKETGDKCETGETSKIDTNITLKCDSDRKGERHEDISKSMIEKQQMYLDDTNFSIKLKSGMDENGVIDSRMEKDHYMREYQYDPSKQKTEEKHKFVDYNHIDYNLEFLRPPGYREKIFESEKYSERETTSLGRNATIYKAQTIILDSQLRSSMPPASDRTESEKRVERHRSKALSEVRSLISERRSGLSRDLKRKPVFSTHLTDRTAVEGSRVKLTCSVLSSADPKITWYKNGAVLDNKLKYTTKFIDGLITLEVLNAVPSDSAEYSCTVENENGTVNTSANLKVYPSFEASPIPPTFTRSIRDTYHLAENELVLECRIRGQPLPTITWLKDDRPVDGNDRYQAYYLADGVCRLAISHPIPEDSGKYTCKAENSVWSDQITHVVSFTGKETTLSPNIATIERSRFNRQALESRRPHFTNVLSDYKVSRGGTIGLQVEIHGCPTRVEWLREGHSVTEVYRNARTFVEHGLYTLALSDVTEKESGLYTCRAWSTHGNVDMNAAITVVPPNEMEGKPAIIVGRPEKDILISVGEDVNISFRVQGDPKPKVVFMKGIRDITNSQRVCKMTSDDYVKFTLKRSVVSDAGTYCVLARNAYGCDRAFVTVMVRQRASSDNLISDWTYHSDDSPVSIADRQYKSVPERIPGEPSVVDGGNNWISLAWPKSDPGNTAPVVAYKVESWLLGKEGGARWVELGITPLNSFDAFNLKQEEQYHFRVTPRNRYGWGESVQTSSPVGIGLAGDRPEFVEILPGQLKVLAGETANLSCSVKGKPLPEVVWMKNGHEIEEEGRMTTAFNGHICSLTIKDINSEDEARYSCEATNSHGRASTYARLAVVTDKLIWEADAKLKRDRSQDAVGEYPPQFTMRLRDRRVQATYPVRLTCQVVGNPPPTLTWFKDGDDLVLDSRRCKYQDEHFHTLEIAPTTLEDGGVYEAMARNSGGAVSCRCSLVVDKGIRAYVAPEFCCGLEPLYRLEEGEELRISAVVEAYPSVGVTWYRDGVRLRPSRRAIMTLDRDGQIELALAFVTARDAGVYTCTASNEVGRASTSGKVEIIEGKGHQSSSKGSPPVMINAPDIPYSREPMFIRKPRSSEAREGDTVIIQCEVIGDPKPDVYWLRDFLKPDYYRDATHFKRVGDGPEYRFEIPHAKLDYTGAYSVVARNVHGEAKAIISLQILAKDPSSDDAHNVTYGRVEVIPRFERELQDLLSYDGDDVEFKCHVNGNPEPDIRWFHYNDLIRDYPDFESSFDEGAARLKIKRVTAEDEGTYLCEASNSLGKATSTACLVIYPPGEPNTLSQRLRRPPALLSAASTPRSTPRSTPARSVSRTPGPEPRRLCSPSRQMPPSFYTYPFNKVVEEGDSVSFKCAVKGQPVPWATWDKDGMIITPSARITLKEKDEIMRILEIEEVTIEDVGIYRITIENEYGRSEAMARLEVITRKGKFYGGVRAYSASPRKSLSCRRYPSSSRQD